MLLYLSQTVKIEIGINLMHRVLVWHMTSSISTDTYRGSSN